MMEPVAELDLNLLVPLDALLTEGSVARASRRLHLSPSAMSRALSRLRAAAGSSGPDAGWSPLLGPWSSEAASASS
jgi:hypothetical protein